MEHHGWEDKRVQLSLMARENKWDVMWKEVTDEMLHEIAVVAEPDEVIPTIRQRYSGLADRICLEWHADNMDLMQTIATHIKE